MNRIERYPFILATRPITCSGDPDNPPAHERIAALFAQIIAQNDFTQSRPLLVELGMHPADESGLQTMHDLIQRIPTAKIRLFKDSTNGPIYQLRIGKDPIGLFKIGRKRAAIELLVRKLAHITGLAKHTTPGVFCALGNYQSLQWEGVFEDLWNGLLKTYSDQQDVTKNPAIVGILEPFDKSDKTTSLEEFAKMTLLALVIGLRDGKDDGYGGSCWFDCEDAFPIRLAPPDTNSVAATDLPYLSDSKANVLLSSDIISKLKALAQSWDLKAIRAYLEQATIDYADTKVEKIPFRDESERFDDEGHNAISLEEPKTPHAVNGMLNHWDIKQNPNRLCLLPAQIETTLERIRLIQTFFASTEQFSVLDLVYYVDRWANTYSQYCHYLNQTDAPITREAWSDLRGGSPLIIGRRTPSSLTLDPRNFGDWCGQEPGRWTPVLSTSFHKKGSTPKYNPTP